MISLFYTADVHYRDRKPEANLILPSGKKKKRKCIPRFNMYILKWVRMRIVKDFQSYKFTFEIQS